MKKGVVIAIEGIIAAALIAACGFVYLSKDRRGPEISFPSEKLTYTDSTDTADLLEGVTASDDRDGDVTSTIRVSSVIPNKNNTKVSVEYTAKDRSNNVTKASQIYDYSGSSTLSELNDPTTGQTQNGVESTTESAAASMPGQAAASSNTDNLSEAESTAESSSAQTGGASASDEAAIAALPKGSPQIRLKTNSATLSVGDTFSYMSYIDSMTDDKDSRDSLAKRIELSGDVDTSKAGEYEVTYAVRDSDGNISNQPKLTVTVK